MKRVIDIENRFKQEFDELNLSQLYYLLGGFEKVDHVCINKATKMIVKRIEELEQHAYVYNF